MSDLFSDAPELAVTGDIALNVTGQTPRSPTEPAFHPAAAQGDRVIVALDPARVRPSDLNPRDPSRLTRDSTAELRDMIATVGQMNPATVRTLAGDPDYDYEVLAGVRRHRCVLDLASDGVDIKLAAVIVDVDDLAAARLADSENRGRAEISEYERGVYLARLLEERFEGKQKRLAAAFGIDPARLSRLVSLARWPGDLIAAFGDTHDIRQQDVTELQASMKDPAATRAIVEHAGELAERQAKLRSAGKPLLDANQIRRKLVAAARPRDDKPKPDASVRLVVRSRSKHGIAVFIREPNQELHDTIVTAIGAALEQLDVATAKSD